MKHFNFIKGFLLALLFVFAAQVKAQTYTVAEAIDAYTAGEVKAATVNGYIVGVVDGSSVAKNSKFTAETEVATNLLLADKADETDPNNCLPVQLPKGAVREALNLVAHPENYGQFVALTGSIEKYFSVAGLKNVTEYSFEGAAPGQPEEPEEPETPVEPETPAGVYISEALTSSFGTFTTQETVGNYPWEIATQYQCAKVTSYDSATKENHEATSWLISTPVDFTNETEAYVAFEYIIRYAESGKVAENHQLLISADYAGDAAEATWVDLPYNAVEGRDWDTFYKANVAVPAEFLGKNGIVFALRYTATTKAGTWEVKNVVVASGTGNAPEQPEEPETPETLVCTVTEALAAFVAGEAKPAVVKGYIVGSIDGKSIDGANFSGTAVSTTNLLIADDADETDITKCLAVQLPSGAVRSALNLVENPGNYKKLVSLTGSLEKYFGVAGLKSVNEYSFDGDAPVEPEQPEEPETPVEPETPEIVVGENILLNSGFEEWNDGALTAWGKDGSNASAHSATIAQSTDADSGIYAVEVAGASSNKRLASKAYTLPAGTYSLSAFIKQSGDAAGAFRLGYAVIKDGAIAYHYLNDPTYVTEEWEYYGVEFTLEEETTVSVLVMNSKDGNGASILVDNVELVAQEVTAVEVTVEDSNAESLYYDLSGRVVKNPANGIYICNGKKVLVK